MTEDERIELDKSRAVQKRTDSSTHWDEAEMSNWTGE
jgi:hypothetical protein